MMVWWMLGGHFELIYLIFVPSVDLRGGEGFGETIVVCCQMTCDFFYLLLLCHVWKFRARVKFTPAGNGAGIGSGASDGACIGSAGGACICVSGGACICSGGAL